MNVNIESMKEGVEKLSGYVKGVLARNLSISWNEVPGEPSVEESKDDLWAGIASDDFLNFDFGSRSYKDRLNDSRIKTGALCAVTCKLRRLCVDGDENRSVIVVWMEHDFAFLGGSLGCAEGEKLARGMEYALENRLPAVVVCRSGGARMQEGTLSLMQMAKVSVAVAALKREKVPFVSVCVDPTYGGVSASYAMQGDLRIAVKEARVGFAGPSVILNTVFSMDQAAYDSSCPPAFQSAEYVAKQGQLDIVVEEFGQVDGLLAKVFHTLWTLRGEGPSAAAAAAADASSSAAAAARAGASSPIGSGDESSSSSGGGGAKGKGKERRGTATSPLIAPKRRILLRSSDIDDASADNLNSAADNLADEAAEPDYSKTRALQRPQAQDVVTAVFDDSSYIEMRGDGSVAEDDCIRGGLAVFRGQPCVVVYTRKGHDPVTMQEANYGMAAPAGYRTAMRLFRLAERYDIPVVTMIDTPGAYPSFESEAAGQSEALATNLLVMAKLRVPIVTIVLGEGGSGGALALGMGDRIGMLQHAYYGVISPEGAASILGRYKDDADKAKRFPEDCRRLASMQRVYARDLLSLGVIDQVILERSGETARSAPRLMRRITHFIAASLDELSQYDQHVLVAERYVKYRSMGKYKLVPPEERLRLTSAADADSSASTAAAKAAADKKKAAASGASKKSKGDDVTSRTLNFIADRTLNAEHSAFRDREPPNIVVPEPFKDGGDAELAEITAAAGETAKAILDRDGPEAVARWLRKTSPTRLHVTDTTMRDAHQSLLATRVRTQDLLGSAAEHRRVLSKAFSLEMWGGATYDVCYRFLHECPWERLRALRRAIPNVCFQMLLRGSNAVGYKSYPDNVIVQFVKLAAQNGIDVFRIFDCFNRIEQMRLSIETVRKVGRIAEVCLCFTGNFLDKDEKIYTLDYWRARAREAVDAGAHIIAIKDMAGLLRPRHAKPLMEALRQVSDLPVHFHTHNTSSASLAAALEMVAAGCDVVDGAMASMADTTSQPSLNALIASTEGGQRDAGISWRSLERLDTYWSQLRTLYQPFESGLRCGSARVFEHQIPGGQYSNLRAQAKSLGQLDRWEKVLDTYRDVNDLFGNIVKVTPSSKCVGDMALYLIGQGLSVEDLASMGDQVEYPASVVDLFRGALGEPHHGFPDSVRRMVLKDSVEVMKGRPGDTLEPVNFEAEKRRLSEKYLLPLLSDEDVMSCVLYPDVLDKFMSFRQKYGQKIPYVPSRAFFYGMELGESAEIRVPPVSADAALRDAAAETVRQQSEAEAREAVDSLSNAAKTSGGTDSLDSSTASLVMKAAASAAAAVAAQGAQFTVTLRRVGPLQHGGLRTLVFDVNGDRRTASVLDESVNAPHSSLPLADGSDPRQVGSPLPGTVEKLVVGEGVKVNKGELLAVVSAMKMEVKVVSPFEGVVVKLHVKPGDKIDTGTLMLIVEPAPHTDMRRAESLSSLTELEEQSKN